MLSSPNHMNHQVIRPVPRDYAKIFNLLKDGGFEATVAKVDSIYSAVTRQSGDPTDNLDIYFDRMSRIVEKRIERGKGAADKSHMHSYRDALMAGVRSRKRIFLFE